MQPIYILQEDKGPKNYSWRKEMESYEEKLDVLSAHKRVVQDSTKATRWFIHLISCYLSVARGF